jgi:hypothetical protein
MPSLVDRTRFDHPASSRSHRGLEKLFQSGNLVHTPRTFKRRFLFRFSELDHFLVALLVLGLLFALSPVAYRSPMTFCSLWG